jgi:CheY-like chemotaxis protein
VTLRVRTASSASGPHELHFSVRDTGIGIPEEERDQLFESFSQVDASMSREYGGTGLGLSISKQLVEAMNGKMWVESEVGEGSTFHFTIKVAGGEPAEEDERPPDEAAILEGARVLVVDDNETTRALLRQQTEAWGMEPTVVASGAEALRRLDRDVPFDAALLDVQMPEMDGRTLAAQLRERAEGAELPIVLLSAVHQHDPAGTPAHATWLHKPIKQSSLHDALTTVL